MDRPRVVDEYREICDRINKLTKLKEKLKPKIRTLIDESGGWDDCYYQESNHTDYIDDNILEWIKKEYPELCDVLILEIVDWVKFKAALNRRDIDIRKMPTNCYVEYKTKSLMTSRRRKQLDETDETA